MTQDKFQDWQNKYDQRFEEPDRCGFGIFSTDEKDPFDGPCKAHDRAYVYKRVTRKEIDDAFDRGVDRVVAERGGGFGITLRGWLYKKLARIGGWFVW